MSAKRGESCCVAFRACVEPVQRNAASFSKCGLGRLSLDLNIDEQCFGAATVMFNVLGISSESRFQHFVKRREPVRLLAPAVPGRCRFIHSLNCWVVNSASGVVRGR